MFRPKFLNSIVEIKIHIHGNAKSSSYRRWFTMREPSLMSLPPRPPLVDCLVPLMPCID